jgi:NAD(P)-dependent dehydrogenase (short-subunit alcohol dehydrogenase family)
MDLYRDSSVGDPRAHRRPANGMNVTYDHTDRVVAVTGAATGIGRAATMAFAQAGAHVFLLDVDDDAGHEAVADVGKSVKVLGRRSRSAARFAEPGSAKSPGRRSRSAARFAEPGSAKFLHCDVTSQREVDQAFERIATDHGRLDVLVNNAGGFWAQRTSDNLPLDEWHRVIDLNLTSVFLTSRSALGLLRASNAGRIINIGSLAGQVASFRTSPAYAAAKAGVHALTRVMASELASSGVTVNAIAPSAVLTERIRQVRDEPERAATARSIPLGRYQETSEVASWILFLASKEAGFVTGQTISVNGGRYMAQ